MKKWKPKVCRRLGAAFKSDVGKNCVGRNFIENIKMKKRNFPSMKSSTTTRRLEQGVQYLLINCRRNMRVSKIQSFFSIYLVHKFEI